MATIKILPNGKLIDDITGKPIPISPTAQNDIAWVRVRAERDMRLRDSDYTQLNDAPITPSKKIEYVNYRKALRDVTLQADPTKIVWPTPPAA